MKIHPTFGTKFTIRLKPSSVDWETFSRPLFYPFSNNIPLVNRAQLHRQVRHYTDGHHTVTWTTNKVTSAEAQKLLDAQIRARIQQNKAIIDSYEEEQPTPRVTNKTKRSHNR